MKKKGKIIIHLFITCLLFSACFQPEEGCLDIEANNFDLAADRGCSKDASSNCNCTYPSVSLSLEHTFNKFAFQPNTIYQTEQGEYIRIQDLQFYMSDIQLVLEDGQIATSLDTVTLTILNESGELQKKITVDDFHLVKQGTNISPLITSNLSGVFTQLQFTIGITEPSNTADPTQITQSSHALTTTEMYSETDGYIFTKITVQPDTLAPETILLQVTETAGATKVILDIPPLTKQPGKTISVKTLQINHAKWFDGINFVENSTEEMLSKIVTNTAGVFSIQ